LVANGLIIMNKGSYAGKSKRKFVIWVDELWIRPRRNRPWTIILSPIKLQACRQQILLRITQTLVNGLIYSYPTRTAPERKDSQISTTLFSLYSLTSVTSYSIPVAISLLFPVIWSLLDGSPFPHFPPFTSHSLTLTTKKWKVGMRCPCLLNLIKNQTSTRREVGRLKDCHSGGGLPILSSTPSPLPTNSSYL